MGSDDEQVKAVFAAALERPSAERAAWLTRVCRGNSALCARVQTLLDAHERAGGFMEDARPEGAADAAPAVPEEQPGAVIGRYKLLQQIGEGGFGSVYMAEQTEPVVRRVALKVIKLGMDTKQVVARFEAERQALAMMDHPNIAKVLDAGATASGRPYFVMELVRGVPITEYCDQANLPTTQRLELFAQVCGALQHAHLKGVIHRDVKPGNVLVTLHDGVPVPKVIDFGIAKATDRRLTEKTLFTEFRQVIGTPEYMSPEQAENSGLDIDTRSDVYSLGVLLYELLTATTPFDAATLREKGYGEMLRIIREDDPPPPSTRIATLGDRLAVAARLHGIAPELWSRRLRGDLDWIVMKCLEKDRTRRYETASGLAADIRRHLDDEPVTAGPPGAGYRWRKFVRRHRAHVAAAGVVLALLVLGIVGTSMGMLRALREKRRADDETARATESAAAEASAKSVAQENEQKAVAEAERAEAAMEQEAAARRRAETISEFVTTALRSSDLENAGGGQGTTVLAAMDNAIADIDSGRFEDDPATRARLQVTIGSILRNNGRAPEADKLLTQALETIRRLSPGDHPDVSFALNELASAKSELGRTEEAERLFGEALDMNRRLFPGDDAVVSRAMANLATVTADPEKAERLFRESLAMNRRLFPGDSYAVAADLGNLGNRLAESGRFEGAEPLLDEALSMAQRVFPGPHPFVAVVLDNLGKARGALGRGDESVDLLTKALAMRRQMFKPPHPDLAKGLVNLADALLAQGRFAEGESLAAEALEMRRRLHSGDDTGVAACLALLGAAKAELGRSAEAVPLLTEAMEMYRRLAPTDSPETAKSLDNLGKSLESAGLVDDAVALLTQALAMRERLYEGDQADLSKGLNNLAWALFKRGRGAEAEAMARRALEMNRRLFPGDHPQLAQTLANLAFLLLNTGRTAEAEPLAEQAVAMYRRFSQADSAGLLAAMLTLGRIRMVTGRVADSMALHEEALRVGRRLLPSDHPDLLRCMTDVATAYYNVGEFDKAIPLFEDAMKGQEARLGREHPVTLMTVGNLGANYASAGRFAEALPLLEAAWQGSEQHPHLAFVDGHLLTTYANLADSANEGGTAKAVAFADERTAAIRTTWPAGSPQLAQALANVALALVEMKAWTRAEPVLREILAIRERAQPDAWSTFNTTSTLGGALLGQKRYTDAEPLLLAGYRGMQEREASIPGSGRMRIPQAIERLVQLYEATGDAEQAAAWRKELESRRAADGGRR